MVTSHLVNWDDVPLRQTAPGVAKRVIEGAGVTLVMVQVDAGIAAPRHEHDHEQFVQVVSGSGTLETAQGSGRFGPGSVFHFPPDIWHAARFETATVLIESNLARAAG